MLQDILKNGHIFCLIVFLVIVGLNAPILLTPFIIFGFIMIGLVELSVRLKIPTITNKIAEEALNKTCAALGITIEDLLELGNKKEKEKKDEESQL